MCRHPLHQPRGFYGVLESLSDRIDEWIAGKRQMLRVLGIGGLIVSLIPTTKAISLSRLAWRIETERNPFGLEPDEPWIDVTDSEFDHAIDADLNDFYDDLDAQAVAGLIKIYNHHRYFWLQPK